MEKGRTTCECMGQWGIVHKCVNAGAQFQQAASSHNAGWTMTRGPRKGPNAMLRILALFETLFSL